MLAGAGQDDDPHGAIVDGAQESVVELLQQDAALRVQNLGPVGRDFQHRPGALGKQCRVSAHAAALSSGARPAPIRSMKLSQ